jgi:hypothetical protein
MMMVIDKLDVYRSIDDPNMLSCALETEEDSKAYIILLVHHAQTYARANVPSSVTRQTCTCKSPQKNEAILERT